MDHGTPRLHECLDSEMHWLAAASLSSKRFALLPPQLQGNRKDSSSVDPEVVRQRNLVEFRFNV